MKGRCVMCPIENITSTLVCMICRMKYVKIMNTLCASCKTSGKQRIEHVFGDMIINHVGHPPNSKDKSPLDRDMCGDLDRRRPDLLWIVPKKRAIVVEIDEDSHVYRESSCETRKISEQNLAIQGMTEIMYRPVITIRVNPDVCDTSDTSLEERAVVVSDLVKKFLHEGDDTEILFCYYHTKSNKHIEEHKKTWKCTTIPE